MKRRRANMKKDGRDSERWNQELEVDNSALHFGRLSNLFVSGRLSDVVLRVSSEGVPGSSFVEFRVHKVVLCAYSDVFEVMLTDPNWMENSQSTVTLREDCQAQTVFPLFLRYLYTGKIKFDFPAVLPILALADKYNVRELADTCLSFMVNRIVCAAERNCLFSWYRYADAVGHSCLLQNVREHVLWNFEQISRCRDFGDLEPHVMVSLLQQNDLVITNELTLFDCVCKWLTAYETRIRSATELPNVNIDVHMEEVVKSVMNQIRFPMMTPRQLAEMLLKNLVNRYKEYFVGRLAMGMSFHSGQVSRVRAVMEEELGGENLFVPRLYTDEKWSASVTIEQFPYLPSYYSQTLVFQSLTTASEECCEVDDKQWEWTVEVYPKGVWFRKFYLIGWERMQEIPEFVMKTVRVALKRKERQPEARVRIGLLVHAESSSGFEYVKKVLDRRAIFDDECTLLNFDDLMPFYELNPSSNSAHSSEPDTNNVSSSSPFGTCDDSYPSGLRENDASSSSRGGQGTSRSKRHPSTNYFVGPNKTFKLQIVVTPVQDRLLTHARR